MKYIISFLLILMNYANFAQSVLPSFFQGTWKADKFEAFEHWDLVNENKLKGISYYFDNNELVVIEYLEISTANNEIFLTANVPGQNKGDEIHFKLTQSDTIFSFENLSHDFPQKIVYKKITDNEIAVSLSGDKTKDVNYRLFLQNSVKTQIDSSVTNIYYDPVLARKFGADDYGMKNYVMVILKTGPNKTSDKSFINNAFRGHLDNIGKMVKDGKLIIAGPFGKNDKNFRGIFIFDTDSFDETRELLQNDPAIKEGLLDIELFKWYGSAALPAYIEYSDKIWKINP